MNKWCALAMMILSLAIGGCSSENSEDSANAQAVEKGEALFGVYCEECHPHTGRGDYLDRIPATLLTRRTEHELTDWILGTESHREMPNFSNLSLRERKDLAAYLLTQIDK